MLITTVILQVSKEDQENQHLTTVLYLEGLVKEKTEPKAEKVVLKLAKIIEEY